MLYFIASTSVDSVPNYLKGLSDSVLKFVLNFISMKKAKNIIVIVALFFGAALFTDVKSQEDPPTPPPTGTCCPTDTGAICVVGIYAFPNYYYLSEGDCPDPDIIIQ